MAWIEFKGIRSDELGLQVMRMPDAVRARRRISEVVVPGRSGALHVDENTYEQITLNAQLNPMGKGLTDEVNEWLSGYGDLILSSDPEKRYRNAVAISEIIHQRYRPAGLNYDSILVTFTCEPHRYEEYPEGSVVTYTNPFTMVNIGTDIALPLITVKGTGNIVIQVGDVRVTLDDVGNSAVIDSEGKEAYAGGVGNQIGVTLNDKDWPVLGLGETRIRWAGDVKSVTVDPRWRWL